MPVRIDYYNRNEKRNYLHALVSICTELSTKIARDKIIIKPCRVYKHL